jgi:putative transposase
LAVIKTFKYRLYPNKAQRYALLRTLDVCRELYNLCLQQRQYVRIAYFAQKRELPALKGQFPHYWNVNAHVLQDVVHRVEKSFQAFFRRCKNGKTPGYPRFKGEGRYDSFCYPSDGFKLAGNYLQLSKVGNIKLRLSRPIVGKIKTCTIKRKCGSWYACFAVEVKAAPLPPSELAVGIDVGVENYAALSDGTMIPNPRLYVSGQDELRKAQRRVARRKKCSQRRAKAVLLLGKAHERIFNRRRDFLHKQTTALIRKYGTIVVENLNVKRLSGGILTKQISDASWGEFFTMLDWKAAEAARELIRVDCKYTSQTCPQCLNRQKKKLSEREHNCPKCGFTAHRDTAAAQVILGRAIPSDAKIGAVSPCLV